ncbi:MAG: polyprenyl synthetase family protein [Neisseria sp.]|nr:polyprenyl synthetase family protein [Neisseria sp.]
MTANDNENWQRQAQAQTEDILHGLLPPETQNPQQLHQAMRYSVLDGGKRLRPLLAFAAAQLGTPEPQALKQAAAAVELIHVYSLVHDDMPAMDNDSLRRGKPTCHVRFGEAAALLAGDALQTLAFDILSRPTALPPARQLRMLAVLAQASGSRGMAGGQAIDLAHVGCGMTQARLEQMHGMKTGALIRAAAALGALSCPDLDDATLNRLDLGMCKLGLAFQVIDDVLDCEADTATLGKTAGKDAEQDKPTYVRLMGLAAAREYAETLSAQASALFADAFGSRAQRLLGLADFITARRH